MSTFVMPGVEVTNRYEHVDTPSTHTIADELHNRNRRNMSRTSIPARGRIAILLVTSRYRNKNRLLLDRHLGSSTDLSLYALNKK